MCNAISMKISSSGAFGGATTWGERSCWGTVILLYPSRVLYNKRPIWEKLKTKTLSLKSLGKFDGTQQKKSSKRSLILSSNSSRVRDSVQQTILYLLSAGGDAWPRKVVAGAGVADGKGQSWGHNMISAKGIIGLIWTLIFGGKKHGFQVNYA